MQADSIVLEAFDMPANTTALFFQGTQQHNNGQGSTFGDGLRCASGSVLRLGTRVAAPSGYIALGNGVAGDAAVSISGAIPISGATRMYQAWYRNAASFCTPASFNLTNGIAVQWQP